MSPADRTRALVRRPGRKQHFATRGPGEDTWTPVCYVPVLPVFGTETTGVDDWHAWLAAAEHDLGAMCALCRHQLAGAVLALRELEGIRARLADVDALETEIRTLRADVARLTTAALDEVRRHATYLRDHVTFRRAAR